MRQHAEYYQDSYEYTIMSYFGSSNTGAVRTGFAQTPLAHDIAAIQSLYGVNLETRTGDTVYGFNSTADRPAFNFTLNANPVVAIWDAGGIDMLDFSGWSSNARIDLAAGAFSDGGGQTSNVQIAFGTTIENAIGGAGNDSLTGNAVGNRLQRRRRHRHAARRRRQRPVRGRRGRRHLRLRRRSATAAMTALRSDGKKQVGGPACRLRLGHRPDRPQRHRRRCRHRGRPGLQLARRRRLQQPGRPAPRPDDRRPGPHLWRRERRRPRRPAHHRQRHPDPGQRLHPVAVHFAYTARSLRGRSFPRRGGR